MVHQFSQWLVSDCSVGVEYSPQTVEDLRLKSIDGLLALRRGGLEIGGLLLGTRIPDVSGRNTIRILGAEDIECSHAKGPGFVLTEAEIGALRKRVADFVPAKPGDLCVLGMYVTNTRNRTELHAQQAELYSQLFPELHQIVLAIKPASLDPCRASIFFRRDGAVAQTVEWELMKPSMGTSSGVFPLPASENPLPASKEKLDEIETKVQRLIANAAFASAASANSAPVNATPSQPDLPVRSAMPPAAANRADAPPEAETPNTPKPELTKAATLPAKDAAEKPVSSPMSSPMFAPQPIRARFDDAPLFAVEPAFSIKMGASLERSVFLPLRKNAKRGLAYVAAVLLLIAAGVGVRASRPLWVTPPPANLTVKDDHGTMTFRWNPKAAEFVSAGTLSVLESGDTKTLALTHDELMKGRLEYTRESRRLTASLALDERRFRGEF